MKTFYRIFAPILSIAIFPVLYFLPLIRAMVSSGLLGALTGSDSGTRTNLLSILGIKEYTSINDIVALVRNGSSSTIDTLKNIWNNLGDDMKDRVLNEFASGKFLIASLVFFGVLVLLALLFAVFSAVMKKQIVPLCLAAGAFVSALVMNACFNAFAKPFVTGVVNLSSVMGSDDTTLSTILGSAVSVDYLQLSVAYTVTLFILVVIMIFTLCALVEEKMNK